MKNEVYGIRQVEWEIEGVRLINENIKRIYELFAGLCHHLHIHGKSFGRLGEYCYELKVFDKYNLYDNGLIREMELYKPSNPPGINTAFRKISVSYELTFSRSSQTIEYRIKNGINSEEVSFEVYDTIYNKESPDDLKKITDINMGKLSYEGLILNYKELAYFSDTLIRFAFEIAEEGITYEKDFNDFILKFSNEEYE